jgi:hypothetical protein
MQTKIVKRGKRRVAFGDVQLYLCKSCGRTFSQSRLARRAYPPRVIRWALQYSGQGFGIDEIQRLLNRRFKIKVSISTVHRWVADNKELIPIQQWKSIVRQYDPLLMKRSFFHENLEYIFQLHRYKIDRLASEQFNSLYKYLWGFESGCPDAFFQIGLRCSQPVFLVDAVARHYRNLACEMAKFAIKSRRSNRERHMLVEEFMLFCDKATVAVEVPVWYWEKSINRGITGHIDVLQIRRNNVYIMDYKPGAVREKKAIQQLYQYATALGFRAKIPFSQLRCAWFDDKNYFEFKPENAEASLIR